MDLNLAGRMREQEAVKSRGCFSRAYGEAEAATAAGTATVAETASETPGA